MTFKNTIKTTVRRQYSNKQYEIMQYCGMQNNTAEDCVYSCNNYTYDRTVTFSSAQSNVSVLNPLN